jgi:hypothetical protein
MQLLRRKRWQVGTPRVLLEAVTGLYEDDSYIVVDGKAYIGILSLCTPTKVSSKVARCHPCCSPSTSLTLVNAGLRMCCWACKLRVEH